MPEPTLHIAVFATHRHPRLRYVLREIGRMLGQKWTLYTQTDQWAAAAAKAYLSYGSPPSQIRAVQLPAHPFLTGRPPTLGDLKVDYTNGLPVFFSTPRSATGTVHDLLACIFFMLSRYEEYASDRSDAHGRFPAPESHAFQNGYLRIPLARLHGEALYGQLRKTFPSLPELRRPRYYFQPSYDIDLLWAYHHRGWKGLASGTRDLLTGKFSRAWLRWRVPAASDSYNILPNLMALHTGATQPLIFWLLSDNTDRHNVNPYPTPPEQIALMHELKGQAKQGIHPGYRTADDRAALLNEVAHFREIMGTRPVISRQHFLKFRLPGTYRHLHAAGIREDHSMGYPDAVGWRAGTNLPFTWYDLEREEATYFKVHPFAAMDVTLKNYLGFGPKQAKSVVLELVEPIRRLGGPFTLLWHNSSFAPEHGWGGWWDIYDQLVHELSHPATSDQKDS